MSKADEMFEKLGYKKLTSHNEDFIAYKKTKKDIIYSIHFDLEDKQFSNSRECLHCLHYTTNYIKMKELQAINEKVKELGWL